MSDSARAESPATPETTGKPETPEEIRLWIQAAADGEPIPPEVMQQIECCVHKSRELDEAKSCLDLMRGCLQRVMCPDSDTRTRLADCIKAGLDCQDESAAATPASISMNAQPAADSNNRSPRPLWLVWIGGMAAGVLITLLLMGGGGQDAMAVDALRSLDHIDSSLVWRMPDEADESHYLRMLECLRNCSICSFVDAIPEPATSGIRLIGAGNTVQLDGRPVASLFYEGGHETDHPWRFIVFMLQLKADERMQDLLPRGRRVSPAGTEAFISCESDGRCCIAWQNPNGVACILSAVEREMPKKAIDIASSFRNCDRTHTVSGCRSGSH